MRLGVQQITSDLFLVRDMTTVYYQRIMSSVLTITRKETMLLVVSGGNKLTETGNNIKVNVNLVMGSKV